MALDLADKTDPVKEGDEAGQPTSGSDGLARFLQISLASPKSGVISVRVVLYRVGLGCLSINPYSHDVARKATLSFASEFGFNRPWTPSVPEFMGYSIRTKTQRCTRWVECLTRKTTAEELYDYTSKASATQEGALLIVYDGAGKGYGRE